MKADLQESEVRRCDLHCPVLQAIWRGPAAALDVLPSSDVYIGPLWQARLGFRTPLGNIVNVSFGPAPSVGRPVPEPATALMFVAGLPVMASRLRSRPART